MNFKRIIGLGSNMDDGSSHKNKRLAFEAGVFILANVLFRINTGLTILTSAVLALAFVSALSSLVRRWRRLASLVPGAPGPNPLPVLGSLHLLDGYKIPYEAFTDLAKKYGNVFRIKMGASWAVVVNDLEAQKEVLITKGANFDGRPTFLRFDMLFGGDKQNSLAFCDYSEAQKWRRQHLQKFTFPHAHSAPWILLDKLCMEECSAMVSHINGLIGTASEAVVDLKPLVMKACANIFNRYFCSSPRFDYADDKFSGYCDSFDEVFWEVNNGRAVDFLPWLMPLFRHSPAMRRMKEASVKVRHFVEEEIIDRKRRTRKSSVGNNDSKDFLDSIMAYIDSKNEDAASSSQELSYQAAIYALEDILGGHSAIGNFTLRSILDLASNGREKCMREVKRQLDLCSGHFVGKASADSNTINNDMISLEDKKELQWLIAAMNETIRMTCSPIVPHTASQDSTIAGYKVPKDTVVFINNHNTSMSEELWTEPRKYNPARFLDPETGEFFKPSHFQPFSMGRRSCMGYKMVQNIEFSIKANLLKHFDISCPKTPLEDIPLGMLALPPKPFEFVMAKSVSAAVADNNNEVISAPLSNISNNKVDSEVVIGA